MDLQAEVVVIGAGPCGAAVTWALARAGVDVLCIDRGDWLDYGGLRRDAPDFEARRRGPLSSNPNQRQGVWDVPIDDRDSPIKAMIAHGAGGTSPFWSAHVPRFRPGDFTMFSDDGVGRDWPVDYDTLAPYYDRLEAQWGVAQVIGDPTLPPRQASVQPLPAIGAHGEKLAAIFDRRGWHWWPVDLVVGQDGAAPEGGFCTHIGPCDLGCSSRRRSGADRAFLRPALESGARFAGGMRVQGLVAGAHGRVTHAICRQGDQELRVHARQFVLAAGGTGTPRLLLISDLANRSGQVGRNLMLHPYARVDGQFDAPQGAWVPQETAGIVSFEFFGTDSARGFKRGMKLQLTGGPGPMATARGAPFGQPLPWGADHHRAFEARFDHVLGFTISADDLPEADNRITLSADMSDSDGLPAAKWHYRVGANSRAILDFGITQTSSLLTEAGASALHVTHLRDQAGFHIMGTARMGSDPARSVTDSYGRCHDLANLFIADLSVFCTASSINPTATAQALALRTADEVKRSV